MLIAPIAPAALLFTLLPGAQSTLLEELAEKARGIHERAVVLDTHVDIGGERYATPELDPGIDNPKLRCDLVKMEEGGVDGVFLAVFVGQGELDPQNYGRVYRTALARFEAIHRVPEQYPDRCALVTSSDELAGVVKEGKRAIMIGMENGYPIGTDLARLAEFHGHGARYITLCHTRHNQICDSSSPGEPLHGGLSELGRAVVAEMNRLGILVDVSHISEQSFWDVLEVTRAPIIASHSGCSGVNAHDRNLTDAQLLALARNGGTIQIVGLGAYLKAESPEHRDGVAALREELELPSRRELRAMTEEERAALEPKFEEYRERLADLEETFPGPAVKDLVDHLEHAVKIAGIDHVGIGTDFDGGGGIAGFQNHAEALNVTLELVRRGFSEEDSRKIWGGNLLRVWHENEEVARGLQGEPSGSSR